MLSSSSSLLLRSPATCSSKALPTTSLNPSSRIPPAVTKRPTNSLAPAPHVVLFPVRGRAQGNITIESTVLPNFSIDYRPRRGRLVYNAASTRQQSVNIQPSSLYRWMLSHSDDDDDQEDQELRFILRDRIQFAQAKDVTLLNHQHDEGNVKGAPTTPLVAQADKMTLGEIAKGVDSAVLHSNKRSGSDLVDDPDAALDGATTFLGYAAAADKTKKKSIKKKTRRQELLEATAHLVRSASNSASSRVGATSPSLSHSSILSRKKKKHNDDGSSSPVS